MLLPAAFLLLTALQEAPPAPSLAAPWLTIGALDPAGRIPFSGDAVFLAHVLDADAPPPRAGATLRGTSGEAAWAETSAADDGGVALRGGGWAYARVQAAADGVWIANLQGAARLFVNGDGFVGDVYGYGFAGVPVALRAGENHVFVSGARGGFRLAWSAPAAPLHRIPQDDVTVPLRAGSAEPGWALRTYANATTQPMPVIAAELRGGAVVAEREAELALPLIPLGVGRLELALTPRAAPTGAGADRLRLALHAARERDLHVEEFDLPILGLGATGLRAHRSRVDDSVQKWAAVPPTPGSSGAMGLVLSLHGASVDCLGQAAAYAQKEDFFIACPTNRRPYGFDWQDWGRADAYEVLAAARRESGAAAERTYLTGHSMGGHGTWHLAVNDADQWAAIAPSAGWASFDSYGGRPRGALDAIWRGADGASETLALLPNLRGLPIYALHGAADDNVPVREMEALLAELQRLGIAAQSHVEPNAGHWWGNACVDWPPIFDTFRAARRPAEDAVREVDFRTADPGVDARHHWLEVEQLLEYGKPARIHARWEGDFLVFQEIENVRRYRVHFPNGTSSSFVNEGPQAWRRVEEPIPAGEKSPGFGGPFKRAFDERFVLVYGTAGTPEEDAALLARARHDAQAWWYRANATPWVLSDSEYLNRRHQPRLHGRNAILYGNADSNAAWSWVVPADCPLRAERRRMRLGEQTWTGEDLAALCVYPGAAGTAPPLVGLIADAGARGSRLGYALRTFVSGVGYPDYAVWNPEMLRAGDGAVLAAGFFDHRWRLAADTGRGSD